MAVDELTLDIAHKGFLVLLAPSGCGKSISLRLPGGLQEVTEAGALHRRSAGEWRTGQGSRHAMVFQSYALYPHMSVLHNMALGLKLRKADEKEID